MVEIKKELRNIVYRYYYQTPSGFSNMLMYSDGEVLTGLYFANTKDTTDASLFSIEKTLPVFRDTIEWLNVYFSGKEPEFIPKMRLDDLTDFRKEVIEQMLLIPYGETTTYGSIANHIARRRGISKMSSRAVGRAVGGNPICIIIPCHRVIGSDQSITGYSGGIQNKIALLKLEKYDINK